MMTRRRFSLSCLAYLTAPIIAQSRLVGASQSLTSSFSPAAGVPFAVSSAASAQLPVWDDTQGTLYIENDVGDKVAVSWSKATVAWVKNGTYYADRTEVIPPIKTYYVDAINGNDNNTGLSQGLAWKTVKKVNAQKFQAGDAILFKRGCLWREQLLPRASGIPGNPSILGNYGVGPLPIISGADMLNNWIKVGGSVYKSPCLLKPNQVFSNDLRLTYKAGLKEKLSENQWDYVKDGSGSYVYVNVPNGPNGKYIEASRRQTCCTAQDCSYIVIDGIYFDKGNEHNLFITERNGSSEQVTVRNCIVSHAYFRGIYHWDSRYASNNFIVEDNEVFNCGSFGIAWTKFANGGIIRRNRTYLNGALSLPETGSGEHEYQGGIAIFGNQIDVRNIIIEHNDSYQNGRIGQPDTGGNGIWIDECMEGNIVRFNRVFDNAGCGIVAENIPHGGEIYCNTVYRNGHGVIDKAFGLFLSRGNQNWRVFNNTLYGNNEGIVVADFLGTGNPYNNTIKNNIAVGSTLRNLRVESTGIVNTVKYNCFGEQRRDFIKWGNQYSTYSAWGNVYASNYSVQQEPIFVNIADKDFRLKAGSPCSGTGENTSLIPLSAGGTPLATSPDSGAFSRLSGVTLDFSKSFLGLTFRNKRCTSLKVWTEPMNPEDLITLTR